MRKILISCLVALFLPFLMTTNTRAEELENQEIEIYDFSNGAVSGELGDNPTIKSIPVIPPAESGNQTVLNLDPVLQRLQWVVYNPSYSQIVNGPDSELGQNNGWIAHARSLIVNWIPLIVGCVFFWWGLRKVISAIMSAFKKGKLRI